MVPGAVVCEAFSEREVAGLISDETATFHTGSLPAVATTEDAFTLP